MTIDYPLEGSVFPPEIVAPTFLWHDAAVSARSWLIEIVFQGDGERLVASADGKRPAREIDYRAVTEGNVWRETDYQASARGSTPQPELWETIKRSSVERDATISVYGIAGGAGSDEAPRVVSRGSVRIRTSRDPLGASVFYRDVPLMPSKTSEGVIQPLDQSMFPLIQWRLRDVSKPEAPIAMQHLPTCGNCHSFSADGKTLAMDMDGPGGDKGAYVVKVDVVFRRPGHRRPEEDDLRPGHQLRTRHPAGRRERRAGGAGKPRQNGDHDQHEPGDIPEHSLTG